MIGHGEIKNLVSEWGIREDVIEKDYVIGWMLWAIGSHERLRDSWVFKGGTSLKKCYFETYRFSEDLDFTVLPGGPFTPDDVLPLLRELQKRIYDETGVEFGVKEPKMKLRPGGQASEGRVYYRGPRGSPSPGSIKIDLSASEKVVRETVMLRVNHPFSDSFQSGGEVRCYSFEELFAEKIRALGERCRPRDLYDVINIHRHTGLSADPDPIRSALKDKCVSKGVNVPTYESIRRSSLVTELASEWESMLAHQLPFLPPYEHYWDPLEEFFQWLERRRETVALPSVQVARNEDTSWSPPATLQVWGAAIPLERIRFAGANRLCIEIDYVKENGQRTRRLVEPYSLRRTMDRNIILHTYDRDRQGHRSYRVDRIRGLQVTSTAFLPRYEVEFSGSLKIPSTTVGNQRAEIRPSFPKPSREARATRAPSSGGFTYIIECPVCEKRFNRKTYTTQLKKHNDKDGYPCFGRNGYLIDTR